MLRLATLLFITLAMLVGQAGLQRFFPASPADIDLKHLFLAVAAMLLMVRHGQGLEVAPARAPAVVWAVLGLSAVTFALSAVHGDWWADVAVADSLFIVVLSYLAFVAVRQIQDLDDFMLLTALVGAGVLAGDYLARVSYGAVFVTNISTARISLVALAAAMFLILRERYRTSAFVLLFVCSFATFSNSLKMGILASGLLLVLAVGMVLYQRKVLNAALVVALIIAGAAAASFAGESRHLGNRIKNFAQTSTYVGEIREETIEIVTPEEMESKSLCEDSANYEFCISDVIVFRDSTQRVRMWLHAFGLFRSNPLIGVGRGGYELGLFYAGDGYPRVVTYTYPHNLIIEYVVMYGLVGLLALALALAVTAGAYVRAAISAQETTVFIALALALLLSAMTGGTLFDVRYLFVFAAALSGLRDDERA